MFDFTFFWHLNWQQVYVHLVFAQTEHFIEPEHNHDTLSCLVPVLRDRNNFNIQFECEIMEILQGTGEGENMRKVKC